MVVMMRCAIHRICFLLIVLILFSCNRSDERFEQLLRQFDSLYAAGQYPEAEQIGNQIWAIGEIPERLLPEYETFLLRMQMATAHQHKYSESARFCEIALVLLKQLNKQHTPAYLSSLTNLSRMYFYQRKYREALDLLGQVVRFRETQNPTDTALYYDYYYLGQALVANGYNEQGTTYIEKSYVLMGDSVGSAELKYDMVTGLAGSYHNLGQPEKAKIWVNSAIQIAEKWKGRKSTEYAQALKVQGQYNYSQGNVATAEHELLEAMTIMEDNGSPYIMNMANILGEYYSLLNSYSKADSFFNIAIQKMNEFSIKQTDPIGFSELYCQLP